MGTALIIAGLVVVVLVIGLVLLAKWFSKHWETG